MEPLLGPFNDFTLFVFQAIHIVLCIVVGLVFIFAIILSGIRMARYLFQRTFPKPTVLPTENPDSAPVLDWRQR